MNKEFEDIEKALRTPKDISKDSLDFQACAITLFFIGYIAKPIGISEELLQKCCNAFNAHRGKFEREEATVLKVLKERKEVDI